MLAEISSETTNKQTKHNRLTLNLEALLNTAELTILPVKLVY